MVRDQKKRPDHMCGVPGAISDLGSILSPLSACGSLRSVFRNRFFIYRNFIFRNFFIHRNFIFRNHTSQVHNRNLIPHRDRGGLVRPHPGFSSSDSSKSSSVGSSSNVRLVHDVRRVKHVRRRFAPRVLGDQGEDVLLERHPAVRHVQLAM